MSKRILFLIGLITLSLTVGIFSAAKLGAMRFLQQQNFVFETESLEYIPDNAEGPGDRIHYKVTGAPPNSPIYWSSWKDGQLVENHVFKNDYTDGQGNWSQISGSVPWNWTGHWKMTIEIGGLTDTVEFDVIVNQPLHWNCHLSSVSKCLEIATQRGSRWVTVSPPFSVSRQQTFDLNEIKQKLTVIRLNTFVSQQWTYNAAEDQIRTFAKYKVAQIMHEPSQPVPGGLYTPQLDIPAALLPIASDEVVLTYLGGKWIVGNVTLRQDYRGWSDIAAAWKVVLVIRNQHNAQLIHLATGFSSVYPVNQEMMRVADIVTKDLRGYHPLISLNPTPNDPSTSANFNMSPSALYQILNQ